jgi:hypothetical protein
MNGFSVLSYVEQMGSSSMALRANLSSWLVRKEMARRFATSSSNVSRWRVGRMTSSLIYSVRHHPAMATSPMLIVADSRFGQIMT